MEGDAFQIGPGALVIEPSFSFDWLYTLYDGASGNRRLDARTFGTEAAYYLPALYLKKGQSVVSRWHFEAHARTGPLPVGAYYELGPVYNGPGHRAGIVF